MKIFFPLVNSSMDTVYTYTRTIELTVPDINEIIKLWLMSAVSGNGLCMCLKAT